MTRNHYKCSIDYLSKRALSEFMLAVLKTNSYIKDSYVLSKDLLDTYPSAISAFLMIEIPQGKEEVFLAIKGIELKEPTRIVLN